MIIQKTTPTLTFTAEGIDLTSYECFVYIKQMDTLITKESTARLEDEDSIVEVTLTPTESLSLKQGDAEAQLYAMDGTDAVASVSFPIVIGKILNPEL